MRDEKETMKKAFTLTNQLRELGFTLTYIPMDGYETWIMFKKLKENKGNQKIKNNKLIIIGR